MYVSDFENHIRIISYYGSKFGQFDHKKSNKPKELGRREYNNLSNQYVGQTNTTLCTHALSSFQSFPLFVYGFFVKY